MDITFLCHVPVQREEEGITRVGGKFPLSPVFHIHGAVPNDIMWAVDGISSVFNENQNPTKPYSPET